jgi:5-methylcytosine-specific restriction protein A
VAHSTDQFEAALNHWLATAHVLGYAAVEVTAGALHRRVGDYPGPNHRMPCCCNAMRHAMTVDDVLVSEPESGAGASLAVRYRLPRRRG